MQQSERTDAIRAYLRQCAQDGHYSPTLREIGAAVGLKSVSSVSHHISKLAVEGFCSRDEVGRIVLAKREPVAAFSVIAMPIMNNQGQALLVPPGSNLTDGQMYRVEVYEC